MQWYGRIPAFWGTMLLPSSLWNISILPHHYGVLQFRRPGFENITPTLLSSHQAEIRVLDFSETDLINIHNFYLKYFFNMIYLLFIEIQGK
jgi:hypothetical protein